MTTVEATTESPSRYPPGWYFHRNYEQVYEDDYVPLDSWTAVRETRSEHGHELRYSSFWTSRRSIHHLPITTRLRIYGKRVKGKLRADRWWASVQVGHTTPTFLGNEVGGKCKSVADAMRQAHNSHEVKALIERTVRWAYTRRDRVTVYCRVTSNEPEFYDTIPAGPPSCEEYLVGFEGLFYGFEHLPPGNYVSFSWRRAYPKGSPSEWRQAINLYKIGGSGGSSGCSPDQHARWAPLFPSWFTPPEYP